MLNRKTLFRMAAINRKTNPWLGADTIMVPNAFLWFSLAALLLTSLIVTFLLFGSYTDNETLSGVIEPKAGISNSAVKTQGEVLQVLVELGEQVTKGTPLMVLRDVESEQHQLAFERERIRRKQRATGEPITAAQMPITVQEKQLLTVKAKVDGTVYQINKVPGEEFFKQQTLITVAPKGDLIVQINVSPTAQSKLTKGTKVVAQLDAFNNDPQGRLLGTIIAVGMAPQKQNNPFANNKTTSYKVLVRLELNQTHFKPDELLGKTVSVKLPLEKRALYQWLLDPMKKLFA